jgi:hypothetical protein
MLAAVVGVPAVVFVLWWFQPQALLFDDVVDETFPTGAGAPGAADAAAAPTDEPGPGEDDEATEAIEDGAGEDDATTEAGGGDAATDAVRTRRGPSRRPRSRSARPPWPPAPSRRANRYTVTGTATAYELEDGQRILRLEDFESTNGPDLYVCLTVAGAADDDAALDAEFVDLGGLTGNIGDQNYVIPDDVDLDRFDSVVIWCRRFPTSFGVADLSA